MDVQFFVNRPHVAAHGVNADFHPVGDFLVGVAVGQLVQKFPFGRRQVGVAEAKLNRLRREIGVVFLRVKRSSWAVQMILPSRTTAAAASW